MVNVLGAKFAARLAVGAIFVAVLVPVTGSGTSGAVSPLPVTCTAAGTVSTTFVDADTTSWALSGSGSCQGDLEGTYLVSFTGVGTSDGMGICADGPVVQDLELLITGTLTSLQPGANPQALVARWHNPLATWPVVTPFAVNQQGGQIGAGTMWTRIFAKCPTAGSPVATFQFATLT
ncbi:MAG TPA: hypothetical protein VGA13_07020 [Acidimicrobiales bacterium]|jgi:hypothetical protein